MSRFIPTVLALLITFASTTVIASEVPFSQQQLTAAQSAGKSVVVAFHAKWCPTCRAQAPILESLMRTPEMKGVTLYIADFDKEKALRRSLSVKQPSTIVVFKGNKEISRSWGEVQRESLAALLKKALT